MEFYVMGLFFKVLMSSPNYQEFELLSLSVAEISVEEETLVAPFLCTETRVVLNKNGATKVSSSADISTTERLSNSNSW